MGEGSGFAVMRFKNVGRVLREFREVTGLNVDQFAQKVGWGKSRQSQYETNRIQISIPVVERISAAFNLHPLFFLLSFLRYHFRKDLAGTHADEILREAIAELKTV